MSEENLFDSEWLSVRRKDGWMDFVHHKNQENVAFAVILKGTKDTLVRRELNPAHGPGFHYTVFSGAIEEDENPEQAVFRELQEESGYTSRQVTDLKYYGIVRPSKYMDMITHLYLVFVEGNADLKIERDGSDGVKGGYWEPIPLTHAANLVQDPCFHAIFFRTIGGKDV
jgi:ADP-ribose pyrophosphatase YjhB (NUDIX family)